MKNDAFLFFLIAGSISVLVVCYIIFAVFTESVRTVHHKINGEEKKKKSDDSKAA